MTAILIFFLFYALAFIADVKRTQKRQEAILNKYPQARKMKGHYKKSTL